MRPHDTWGHANNMRVHGVPTPSSSGCACIRQACDTACVGHDVHYPSCEPSLRVCRAAFTARALGTAPSHTRRTRVLPHTGGASSATAFCALTSPIPPHPIVTGHTLHTPSGVQKLRPSRSPQTLRHPVPSGGTGSNRNGTSHCLCERDCAPEQCACAGAHARSCLRCACLMTVHTCRDHRGPGDRLSSHCAGAVLGRPFGEDHPECQAVLRQGRGADCEG